MKLYTRTGDKGETSVIGGRVRKDDARVEAYGTVDELNSYVGQVVSILNPETDADMIEHLVEIQHELFDCGADLAVVGVPKKGYKVEAAFVERLETWIDAYDAMAEPITRFILPGGSQASALFHVCRTVCRRAERRVVSLAAEQEIHEEVRRYLNRLSDLFFAMARAANARSGQSDVEYIRSAEVFRTKP